MNIRLLQEHLKQNNLYLKKSLSQNFLIDENIQQKIIRSAAPNGCIVLEIGPGAGMLTKGLIQSSKFVIGVEKDSHFSAFLKEKFPFNLKIIKEDFLKICLDDELDTLSLKDQKIKVIANIPYQITAPILVKLLTCFDRIDSITLMVQEEVAQRIISSPGTKNYGRLSIFCQFYAHSNYLFSVSRNCFYPKPKIQSAVIQLIPRNELLLEKNLYEFFFSIVKQAFQYRRKTLVHIFKRSYQSQNIIDALLKIGKGFHARAEELSLNEFIEFAKLLSNITITNGTNCANDNPRG